MIDSYLWGKVDRISPEAPVPIVSVEKREKRLGGAANVAMNVKALGAEPILCSFIGRDADAGDFLQLMKDQQLVTEGILQSANRITTIKHRILAGHQHLLRVDAEVSSEITEEETNLLFQKINELLPACDAVIFEDYDKGVLNKALIERVIGAASLRQKPTIVDPKKRNFLHYEGATLFKPNLKELKEGLKIDFNSGNLDELKNAVKLLKEKMHLSQILVTLSEKGVYIDTEEEKLHIPAHIRFIADVSGAGDTVVSVAALCLALNLGARVTASLANLAGGLVCEQVGVVSVDKNGLLEEALNDNLDVLLV